MTSAKKKHARVYHVSLSKELFLQNDDKTVESIRPNRLHKSNRLLKLIDPKVPKSDK